MPLFDFHCQCGHHFELLLDHAKDSAECWDCGATAPRVPSRFALRMDRPAPLNTAANQARYREIVDETLDLGRRRAEEQGEPMGEHGAALVPRQMAEAIMATRRTFEEGLAE